jgi:short-subunit dehydrogenase
MSGRIVIVTGASSGIGEATARAFAAAGDRVVLIARRAERLQQLASEFPGSLAVPADLTRSEDIRRVIAEALHAFGRIDVLVNNAGRGGYDWLERLEEDDIRQEIALNLMAPILLTRSVLPMMQGQGSGVIINVGSAAGRIGAPTLSIYNTAKFGLDGFSEALRREVGPQGIRVCVIYPGGVAGTEFGRAGKRVDLGVTTPAWLRLEVERVAAAIVGLADHPRPRVVIPWPYHAAIALNALLPSAIDRLMAPTVRRARSSGGQGPGARA